MRYTTIIDVSEMPAIYRSTSARLVYLHLCLRAGYHDIDRDLADCSIRKLAADTGLSISATRHALRQLEAARLISRQGTLWFVRKWLEEQPISTRARTQRQQKQAEKEAEAAAAREARERQAAVELARRKTLEQQGKTNFMLYYEDQMRRAEAGDQEAAAIVRKNRQTYEAHAETLRNKLKQQEL